MKRILLIIAFAALLTGCNDPYQPVSNPNAAEEAALKQAREEAETVRRKAEEQAEAIRQAQITAAGK